MLCVSGRREELPQRLMEDVGRYRHKVFIGHLGWPLRSSGEIESDEFDGPSAVYVSSRDERGQVNGVARLLPTTTPYLLEKVFVSLWADSDLPHSEEVWELSRFAMVDFNNCSSIATQASSRCAANFFRQVVRVAVENGARMLITVSPIGMERLLRVNGFFAARAGAPKTINGDSLVALRIDCNIVG